MKTPGDTGARPEERWNALVLELPAALAGELAAALRRDILGSEIAPGSQAGHERVTLYLRGLEAPAEAERRLARLLADWGLDARGCDVRQQVVTDGRWVERYQAQLRPFRLGRRFAIDPTGGARADELPPDRQSLALVPGRAFGTGEHPTTQLAVELLERHVQVGSRWLDVGCGTGVLSIVAVLCGAGRVRGVDLDPEAVGVATEVLAQNGVADRVELARGGIEEAAGTWDGVVVNIGADFFRRHAAALRGAVAPRGRLIATGFLEDDLVEMEGLLAADSLPLASRAVRAPWAALSLGPAD